MFVAACVVLGGCAFEPGSYPDPNQGGGGGGHPGGGGIADPMPDAGAQPVATTTCQYTDAVLCLELDDHQLMPKVTDESAMKLDSTGTNLTEQSHGTGFAARFSYGSNITVQESAALDITDALSYEMDVRPNFAQSVNLLVNTAQYVMQLAGDGRVGCSLAGVWAWSSGSNTVEPGSWTHVACTFAGGKLKVFVDGMLAGQTATVNPIATGGSSGTTIGTAVSGYYGALDDIRVYARELTSTEVCHHAGYTACASSGSGESGDDGP